MAAPSPQSRVLNRALRLGVRPVMNRLRGNSLSIRGVRLAIDAGARLMRTDPRVRVEPLREPLRGEWVRRIEAPSPDGAILYLHGGGYVLCSPQTHRPITGRLALDTGLPVLVPDYRLAPEHPFPAALDDAVAAYEWLLTRYGPSRLIVAGDSAGGHLAASLVAELCRRGLPAPAAAVLYSPWVDLACELSLAHDRLIADPYLSPAAARRVGRMVVSDFEDPRVALMKCAWTGTVPPFLIQVGGAEVLRPEAEGFAELLTSAGVSCELQIWPGQMHVFQLLNRILPESSAAMRDTARFIATSLPATPLPERDHAISRRDIA
jgi:acetyl esterase/lipase